MSTISASTTSNTAFKVTSDTTGTLVLQTGAVPTTAISIDASQVVSIGSIAVTGVTTFSAGSAAAPSITTTGDTNTGIYFPAADTIAFTEGGVEAARIDSSGNVGIGTASPTTLLSLAGSTATTFGLSISPNGWNNARHRLTIPSSGDESVWSWNYTGAAVDSALYGTASIGMSNGFVRFSTGNVNIAPTERMRLDSSGNLGIGMTPNNILDITQNQNSSATSKILNNSAGAGARVDIIATNGTAQSQLTTFGTGFSTTGIFRANGTLVYATGAGGLTLSTDTAQPIYFATNQSERMRLDSSGNLGIGTTSPSGKLHLYQTAGGSNTLTLDTNFGSGNAFALNPFITGVSNGGFSIRDVSNGTDRIVIQYSTGNVGIGTTSPDAALSIFKSVTYSNIDTFPQLIVGNVAGATGKRLNIGYDDTADVGIIQTVNRGIAATNLSIQRYGGDLLVATTTAAGTLTSTSSISGIGFNSTGYGVFVRSSATPLYVNRLTNDGELVEFNQAGVTKGTISVSGSTVSYNAFAGSHWSQLQDGSKPDILRGTVMESINELCVWPDEQNERLPKSKISDTASSKKVYGVFMAWDNDWTTTNDMYITAVGAFICRVNASVTVQEGDLLESNGDGTARVQADDIIRSSTIGKVTSTVKTHQYDDGSYCVPTVLYCG